MWNGTAETLNASPAMTNTTPIMTPRVLGPPLMAVARPSKVVVPPKP